MDRCQRVSFILDVIEQHTAPLRSLHIIFALLERCFQSLQTRPKIAVQAALHLATNRPLSALRSRFQTFRSVSSYLLG